MEHISNIKSTYGRFKSYVETCEYLNIEPLVRIVDGNFIFKDASKGKKIKPSIKSKSKDKPNPQSKEKQMPPLATESPTKKLSTLTLTRQVTPHFETDYSIKKNASIAKLNSSEHNKQDKQVMSSDMSILDVHHLANLIMSSRSLPSEINHPPSIPPSEATMPHHIDYDHL